jgi:hypothetical protein
MSALVAVAFNATRRVRPHLPHTRFGSAWQEAQIATPSPRRSATGAVVPHAPQTSDGLARA